MPYPKPQGGAIINTGSMAAVAANPEQCSYVATKHALLGFSMSAFEVLRHHGVKVCIINPGAPLTDFCEHTHIRPLNLSTHGKREGAVQPGICAETTQVSDGLVAACTNHHITLHHVACSSSAKPSQLEFAVFIE